MDKQQRIHKLIFSSGIFTIANTAFENIFGFLYRNHDLIVHLALVYALFPIIENEPLIILNIKADLQSHEEILILQ